MPVKKKEKIQGVNSSSLNRQELTSMLSLRQIKYLQYLLTNKSRSWNLKQDAWWWSYMIQKLNTNNIFASGVIDKYFWKKKIIIIKQ